MDPDAPFHKEYSRSNHLDNTYMDPDWIIWSICIRIRIRPFVRNIDQNPRNFYFQMDRSEFDDFKNNRSGSDNVDKIYTLYVHMTIRMRKKLIRLIKSKVEIKGYNCGSENDLANIKIKQF